MNAEQDKKRKFTHGHNAYMEKWCDCKKCIDGHNEYNAKRRENMRKLRESRAYYKNLATIPIDPLIEWIEANNKWDAVDRFKRRTIYRNQHTKVSIYEIDKICSLFGIHPIEVYGWNWIANPDITEGAEVVD
jgi:hypothetical protein